MGENGDVLTFFRRSEKANGYTSSHEKNLIFWENGNCSIWWTESENVAFTIAFDSFRSPINKKRPQILSKAGGEIFRLLENQKRIRWRELNNK